MAAHELGYLAERADAAGPSHSYVVVAAPLLFGALCVAGWLAALRIVRRDTGRAPSWISLSSIQVSLYVVIEVVERVASGTLGTLWSVPVAAGLALQPVIAAVAVTVLRVGRRVIEMVVARTARPRLPAALTNPARSDLVVPVGGAVGIVRLRGPPAG